MRDSRVLHRRRQGSPKTWQVRMAEMDHSNRHVGESIGQLGSGRAPHELEKDTSVGQCARRSLWTARYCMKFPSCSRTNWWGGGVLSCPSIPCPQALFFRRSPPARGNVGLKQDEHGPYRKSLRSSSAEQESMMSWCEHQGQSASSQLAPRLSFVQSLIPFWFLEMNDWPPAVARCLLGVRIIFA